MQRVIIPTALRVEIGRQLLAGGVSGKGDHLEGPAPKHAAALIFSTAPFLRR
jgi:hypothetical protein